MATIINADTSNGLKLTSDTSGQLELQSAGSTKVTMNTSGKVGIGGTPSEPLSVFRTGGQEEGINIRNTSSGNGSRLTFETTRSDDSSVQDMAAIQVYAVSGYDSAANSDAVMTFQTQDSGTTSERMRIDSSGNVLINQTSKVGAEKLNVSFNRTGEWGMVINNTSSTAPSNAVMVDFRYVGSQTGYIGSNGTSTSYNTSSDYRLKENVVPMSGSIDRLKQLKPSTWAWVQDGSHGEGFLAHEAQEVVPEAVVGTKDAIKTEEYEVTPAVLGDEDNVVTEAVMGTREVPDYQGIDQSKLVPLLTAALQEAITKIEDLETRIQALENA
jgi:hypothetical protein